LAAADVVGTAAAAVAVAADDQPLLFLFEAGAGVFVSRVGLGAGFKSGALAAA
jgi:hypothetical protein